jgi:hypothetical protein
MSMHLLNDIPPYHPHRLDGFEWDMMDKIEDD